MIFRFSSEQHEAKVLLKAILMFPIFYQQTTKAPNVMQLTHTTNLIAHTNRRGPLLAAPFFDSSSGPKNGDFCWWFSTTFNVFLLYGKYVTDP